MGVRDRTGHLVGRQRELDELTDALESAVEGHGTLFLLSGEPGVGKTRLAQASAADATAAGFDVVWGRCWESGGAPAYWPWTQILRELVRVGDEDALRRRLGAGAALVARVVPEAGARIGVEADQGDDGERTRFLLFDAVATYLRNVAEERPLVLIIDDLHGADQPSLLLLEFIARELLRARIVVLATFRDAEARLSRPVAEVLGRLARESRRLPLSGLTVEQVGEVVGARGGQEPSPQVVEVIHRATEGNPFFVDEVVRMLAAQGRLGPGAAMPAAVEIPDTIRGAIRRRLEPLPEEAVEALTVASVVGRSFSLAVVGLVTGWELDRVGLALSDALDAGVVADRPGRPGDYEFTHTLIGETLYQDLGPVRRVQLHLAVGQALEARFSSDDGDHLAELAHHFFQAATAGQTAKAIEYSVRAGDNAAAVLAYEEAAEHYERALQAFGLEERADVPRRCDLLLSLGAARGRAGDVRAARQTFLLAAGLARQLDEPERLARAALGYGAGLGGTQYGRVDEQLVALLDEAKDALGEGDSPLGVRVRGRIATELYFSGGSTARRRALSDEAVAAARRLGDPAAIAAALSARHLALWSPANVDERLAAATEILQLGEQTGDRELSASGHVWRLMNLLELGEVLAVDRELEAIARLAPTVRDPIYNVWYVPLFGAMRAIVDGRFATAEQLILDAFNAARRVNEQNALWGLSAQFAVLRWLQGRLGEVFDQLGTFVERYPAQPIWRAGLAWAASELGRVDEARASLDHLAGSNLAALRDDGEWLPVATMLAEAAATVGDAGVGSVLYERLLPLEGRLVVAGRGAVTWGPVSRTLGRLALLAGDAEAADRHLGAACAQMAQIGGRPMLAIAQADRAAAVAAMGDATEAARLRRSAADAAKSLGMAALAAQLDASGDGGAAAAVATTPSEPASAALVREGEVWAIHHGGRSIHLRHSKGLHQLAILLAAPEKEFHAAELVTAVAPGTSSPSSAAAVGPDLTERAAGDGDAGPLLDRRAKAEYRRRHAELRAELDEAERFADPERILALREEVEFLERELAAAVGLGGRDRRAASNSERARVNATRALRGTIERIAEHDPQLGRHLERSIVTGTYCAYRPDPAACLAWDVRG